LRKPQLEGDLRRIRSGGDKVCNCAMIYRSNAEMMKQKKKKKSLYVTLVEALAGLQPYAAFALDGVTIK